MTTVKLKDIKSGVVLYKVYAFVALKMNGKIPQYNGHGWITTMTVVGRPNKCKHDTVWIPTRHWSSFHKTFIDNHTSAKDAGIIPNGYNMHKTFRTKRAAARYLNRIESLCLSTEEWTKAIDIADYRAERDLIDTSYDSDNYWLDNAL